MPVCLLTGATGFIGRHAVRLLPLSGWTVHALVRSPERLAGANVQVYIDDGSLESIRHAVRASAPDVVIHMATCYIKDHRPDDIGGMFQANVLFGTWLLEAMTEAGSTRLLTIGTAWQHLDVPDDSYRPATLYAATKQAFEDIARWYTDARNVAVTALHFGDTYGSDDPRPKIFALLEKSARSGETLEMSPGGQKIDPMHVRDAVRAIHVGAHRLIDGSDSGFHCYRVTPGKPRSLREVVDVWCAATSLNPCIAWGARPYRARETMTTWQGGLCLPGWDATILLEDGLADTVATVHKPRL
jgi:nucleoside-diphosphate-sugar epimerase